MEKKSWKIWCDKRKRTEQSDKVGGEKSLKKRMMMMMKRKDEVNVREFEPTTLSGILKRFCGEVCGMQGSDLSPSSTSVGIRVGLQRRLSGMRSGIRDEQLVQVDSCSVAHAPTALQYQHQ